jgi:hypothetical protein
MTYSKRVQESAPSAIRAPIVHASKLPFEKMRQVMTLTTGIHTTKGVIGCTCVNFSKKGLLKS